MREIKQVKMVSSVYAKHLMNSNSSSGWGYNILIFTTTIIHFCSGPGVQVGRRLAPIRVPLYSPVVTGLFHESFW